MQGKAGAYAGKKKYGEAANLPAAAMKNKSAATAMKAGGGGSPGSKVHKPHLDEMHGPESLPYRGERALPAKPFGGDKPDHPAERLAAVGPGVRAVPAVDRRRAGQARRVEEEVALPRGLTDSSPLPANSD